MPAMKKETIAINRFEKMSQIRFLVQSEFYLSKTMLRKSTQYMNNVQKLKVNKTSSSKRKTGLQHLDFITIIIPFFSIFFVIMLISMVNLCKTSRRAGSDSNKHCHLFTPDIQITEPSSASGLWEEITDTHVGYLSPKHKGLQKFYDFSKPKYIYKLWSI